MKSVTRDLIEYSYDNMCLPLESHTFKQINVDTVESILDCKPDIEQILKVSSKIKVTYFKSIKTPIGKSLEGNVLTGRKLLVEGIIEQKVQYVACEKEQSIHFVNFSSPFFTYVVIPNTIPCCNDNFVVTAFFEDVTAKADGCRQIYINNTILIAIEN